MNNPLTKLAVFSAMAASAGWSSVPDKAIPCNFPRSRDEINKKHKANKARKAAKKARRCNRRK
jgi:hypothetical protein